MKHSELERTMRRGVVLPETPKQRSERAALEEDLRSMDVRGKPLSIRPRLFRSSADAYLVATRGPLPYMLRLREIERLKDELETMLRQGWSELAEASAGDARRFAREWISTARRTSFDEINDLIDRHNRWYPVESRLPMDPRRGDYVLVNGHDYRLDPLDAEWVLEHFPPELALALE